MAALTAVASMAPCQQPAKTPREQGAAPQATRESRKQEGQNRQRQQQTAHIAGRCVDDQTDEPLAGCRVTLSAWGGRSMEGLPAELLNPEAVTTGADGRFSIAVLANRSFQVSLQVTHSERSLRNGRWRYLEAGTVEDVGDIRLAPGTIAAAKIVDADGQPVAGATVAIDGLALSLAMAEAARPANAGLALAMHDKTSSIGIGPADKLGAARSRWCLPPGTYDLAVRRRGLSLVEPRTITIPTQGAMQPLRIVVKQEPYIAGIVVDESGTPASGVGLGIRVRRTRRMLGARSKQDGRFRIYRAEHAPDRVRINIDDPGPCEPHGPTQPIAWGTHDVRIELKRLLTLTATVVMAGSGEPVEDFAIRCYATKSNRGMARRSVPRLAGRHENGTLTVDRVAPGKNRLYVIPKDPTLRFAKVDLDATKGVKPLRIQVQKLVPQMVQLVDADGQPIANTEILTVEPGGTPHSSWIDPRHDGPMMPIHRQTEQMDVLVHRAKTDGGGTCVVYGTPGRKDLALLVCSDTTVLKRVDDVAFGTQRASLQIVLDR
ncbi:MAG: hypothetical protein AB8H80_22865 [Planctomycetota bacterium]